MNKGFIEKCDIFSIQANLLISGNSNRAQNKIGGAVSIFALTIMFSAVIYFFREFVNREKATIMSNIEITNKVNLENIHNVPFMMRLSDHDSLAHPDRKRIWNVGFMNWWTDVDPDSSTNDIKQFYEFITLEKCDLNKHFGEYKYLFANYTDIDTFYCPDWKGKNHTLKGLYGDAEHYNYLHYWIAPCINTTKTEFGDLGNCLPEDFNLQYLSRIFFDWRTVDNIIKPLSSKPFEPVVVGERFPVSNTVYKRQWMFFRSVDYFSDIGYVFQEETLQSFFQIDNYRSDIDLRTNSYRIFFEFTMTNSKTKVTYLRSYMKAQNFLANVGGIIKGITVLGMVLTYISSKKILFQKYINSNHELTSLQNEKRANMNSNNNISLMFNDNKNKKGNNFIDSMISIAPLSKQSKNPFMNNNNNNNNNNVNNNLKNNNNNNLKDNDSSNSNNNVLKKNTTKFNKPIENNYMLNINKVIETHRTNTRQIKLTSCETLFPFCCSSKSKNKEIYNIGEKVMYGKLNLINLLSKLEELEKLKIYSLTDDQYKVFTYMHGNSNNNIKRNLQQEEYIKSIGNIINKNKEERNNIDNNMIEYTNSYIQA